MADAFRSRSSTWSEGTTIRNFQNNTDSPPQGSINFDSRLVYPKGTIHDSLGLHSQDQRFRYSPTDTVNAIELGSQDFYSGCMYTDKTPVSDYGSYRSFLNASNGNHSLTALLPSTSQSNFSVMPTSASPFSHPDVTLLGGANQPLYSSSSPYSTNESCCPDSTTKHVLHSASPSSVGSSHISAIPISTSASKSTKRPARRNPWGPETYSDLIAKAIESYPEKQATLQQIYDFISSNHIYFRERSDPPASAGWKVGIILIKKLRN